MSTEVTTKSKNAEIAQQLNNKVFSVLGEKAFTGFERAYQVAVAVHELKTLLSAEFMKPIMFLQGNKLGFKSDKDKTGGYAEDIVKNCLIEAVLMGLQPSGNQFNIIAGNTYVTKEGMGELLKQVKGLNYSIIPQVPVVNDAKSGAVVDMHIKWSHENIHDEEVMPVSVKMDAYTSTDAVIGKATRKARAWLFYKVTGQEIPEGEATEYDAKVISTIINTPVQSKEEIEADRTLAVINSCTTEKALLAIFDQLDAKYHKAYQQRMTEVRKANPVDKLL